MVKRRKGVSWGEADDVREIEPRRRGPGVLECLARADFEACGPGDADIVEKPSLAIACSAAGGQDGTGTGGDRLAQTVRCANPCHAPCHAIFTGIEEPIASYPHRLNRPICRWLLQHGARADAVDGCGRSAALICVLLGESAALRVLLAASPPPNLLLRPETDGMRMSPLGAAYAQGVPEIQELVAAAAEAAGHRALAEQEKLAQSCSRLLDSVVARADELVAEAALGGSGGGGGSGDACDHEAACARATVELLGVEASAHRPLGPAVCTGRQSFLRPQS